MKIVPINGHVLIKPLVHESLLPTEKGTYDEVGIIIDIAEDIINSFRLSENDKVWFDSWRASKHPTGESDEYFWLVPHKDLKAVEYQEDGSDTIPE